MKVKSVIGIILLLFPLMAFSQDMADMVTSTKARDVILNNKLSPRDTLRRKIIEKAAQYIGVDYKWGQSGEDGFDCSGYVKFIYGQFGYKLPHSSYDQYNSSRRLIESKAKPGDLVFFVTRGSRISHVGIYLGNKTFIHAPSTGNKVRIESMESGFFRRTLAGFGTIF